MNERQISKVARALRQLTSALFDWSASIALSTIDRRVANSSNCLVDTEVSVVVFAIVQYVCMSSDGCKVCLKRNRRNYTLDH